MNFKEPNNSNANHAFPEDKGNNEIKENRKNHYAHCHAALVIVLSCIKVLSIAKYGLIPR